MLSSDQAVMSSDGKYISDQQLKGFLSASYKYILSSHVYMQYNELEQGFPSDPQREGTHRYIYQNLVNDLQTEMNPTDSSKIVYTRHERELRDEKIKNKVPISFDAEKIVDAIENGKDEIDHYSKFEQNVLSVEITYRNSVHDDYYH